MVNYVYLDKLMTLSTIEVDWNRIEYIDTNWDEFTKLEYYSIIEKLKESQLDPITSGQNYNQTDILTHLKKLR